MKKVRYVAGVIGVVPALGLMVPAANPAGAAVSAGAKPAKAVSLVEDQAHLTPLKALNPAHLAAGSTSSSSSLSPDIPNCFNEHSHTNSTVNLSLRVQYASVAGEPHCVWDVRGVLFHKQSHLLMRTRIYRQPNGKRVYQHFSSGSQMGIAPGRTSFPGNGVADVPHPRGKLGNQVCIALVSASFRRNVEYGPVCETE
jgi:hypothetical protein